MTMMQAFYWDCPSAEDREGRWWSFVESKLDELSNAGISMLWLPPSAKAGHVDSMGYAPYDYYDHGQFDQKGGTKTWFGSSAELKSLIRCAHRHNMTVLADAVLNHCDRGDSQELSPISRQYQFTKFSPASGKWACPDSVDTRITSHSLVARTDARSQLD